MSKTETTNSADISGPQPAPKRVAHPLVSKLFTRMDDLGLSGYAVAPRAGVSRVLLHTWKNGAMPSLGLFAVVAECVDMRLVLVDADEPPVQAGAQPRPIEVDGSFPPMFPC
jgi:hypothetical protein